MAKINITEGELKQIIKESVISEITEAQKDRFNRRYNAYNTALQDYNNNFSKNWADLSDIEKQKWQDEYNKIKSAPNSSGNSYNISPESIYNSRKNSAQTTMDQALNRRGVGAKMKEQLDIANKSLTSLYQQLNAKDHTSAMGNIQNLQSYNSAYKKAIQDITDVLNGIIKENVSGNTVFDDAAGAGVAAVQIPGIDNIIAQIKKLKTENNAFHNAIGSKGNMQTALKTINQWKKNSVELTNLQKTSQQQAATIQQQQTNAQKTQQGHMQANQTRVAQNKFGNLGKVQPPAAMQQNNGLVK